MLHNFVYNVCGCAGDWKMDSFVESAPPELCIVPFTPAVFRKDCFHCTLISMSSAAPPGSFWPQTRYA